jgi:hypothetical protein
MVSLLWKENETKYPEPSKLAEKFLRVPASVNISGLIFNPKRRGLGVENNENLLFLKLNETYLLDKKLKVDLTFFKIIQDQLSNITYYRLCF